LSNFELHRGKANVKIKTMVKRKASTRTLPAGAVLADHNELKHINTYGELPTFYVDKSFVCRDCGVEEIWTAEQQKWLYEVAKGHIDSTAVRCRTCRKKSK